MTNNITCTVKRKIARVVGFISLFVMLPSLLAVEPIMAQEGIKGNLVTVNWLEKHLNNADVIIIDASPAQIYSTQHIPGAVNADLFTYGIREVPLAELEQRYQNWGISPGKKIVIYDQGGSMMATRLFFDLYYNGFPVNDLLILNGGLYKWQQAGLQVTKDIPNISRKGIFKIGELNENVRIRLPEFLNASGDTRNNALLEALGADWHFGEVKVFDRAGHIPNGILIPSTDFYNPDKTFKSSEEIKKMVDYLGVRPEQQIYTYCGGGVAASVPFFALKFILNYPSVKLYKESEMGWLKDERKLPYWTYDAPFIMREASWLQIWGGKMLRMYGGAQVSIVDVRSVEAYNQEHIPFAINIPADVFKSNINNPGKLADIFGHSGVNVSDEAVVISGAGLTKESALAFVMLEKSGQKKVSVFMDSMDKWAQLGFAVTKDVTVISPEKNPNDLSVPPTAYPVNIQKDVIITDPKSTHGYYPKVFIAAGANLPAQVTTGKVVHVPYTDLLNADGTPKAANEIWNILTEAGVPRYAELICFSDDTGEAAVNYFILKLMGYPDIKMLVF